MKTKTLKYIHVFYFTLQSEVMVFSQPLLVSSVFLLCVLRGTIKTYVFRKSRNTDPREWTWPPKRTDFIWMSVICLTVWLHLSCVCGNMTLLQVLPVPRQELCLFPLPDLAPLVWCKKKRKKQTFLETQSSLFQVPFSLKRKSMNENVFLKNGVSVRHYLKGPPWAEPI